MNELPPKPVRLGVAAIALCAAGAIYSFDPAGTAWYPKCPFHVLTGWHCPGCGSTRAAHALLHGDLASALAFNALFVSAAPILLAFAIGHMASRAHAETRAATRLSPRWIWLLIAILTLFTVLRNIPAYPFNLLAPH